MLADLARLFPALRLWASPSPVANGSTVARDQPTNSSDWQHPRFSESGAGQPSTTIDGVVAACGLEPTFVKIDVEGAEHSVLQGMQETLEKCRPTVMLELHSSFLPAGISPFDVEQLLLDQGYRCHPVGHDVRPQDIERQIWTPA